MNQIIDFDLDTLTLVVEPGVTNGDVRNNYIEAPKAISTHLILKQNTVRSVVM